MPGIVIIESLANRFPLGHLFHVDGRPLICIPGSKTVPVEGRHFLAPHRLLFTKGYFPSTEKILLGYHEGIFRALVCKASRKNSRNTAWRFSLFPTSEFSRGFARRGIGPFPQPFRSPSSAWTEPCARGTSRSSESRLQDVLWWALSAKAERAGGANFSSARLKRRQRHRTRVPFPLSTPRPIQMRRCMFMGTMRPLGVPVHLDPSNLNPSPGYVNNGVRLLARSFWPLQAARLWGGVYPLNAATYGIPHAKETIFRGQWEVFLVPSTCVHMGRNLTPCGLVNEIRPQRLLHGSLSTLRWCGEKIPLSFRVFLMESSHVGLRAL